MQTVHTPHSLYLHMLPTQFTHSCTYSLVQNMTLFTHLTKYWICIPLHTFCTYSFTLADSQITVSLINYNTIHSILPHLYEYIYCCSHITILLYYMPHHLLIQMYINNHTHTVCINVNIPWTWAMYARGKIRLFTLLLGCVCPRWKHSFGYCLNLLRLCPQWRHAWESNITPAHISISGPYCCCNTGFCF